MHTRLLTSLSTAMLLGFSAHAQFDLSQVEFWIGTGQDSSVLVVDFQDGSDDPSYAWGFLHDGATGEEMINAIAAADVNLTVEITTGFLNSITYSVHAGIGGDPNYWSTWSGTHIADMVSNLGISGVLANGEWLGCSYTNFDPALAPREPFPALDPLRFTMNDVLFWVGTGQDSSVLVIDFLDGSANSAYAWGYLHDGSATAGTMLMDIAAADASLEPIINSGFLSDIVYGAQEGIGGSPFYWSTWSGTNLGNWVMNLGLSTQLQNGDLFGCSYTDYPPPIAPGYPIAAENTTGFAERSTTPFQVFPQPASDALYVRSETTRTLPYTIHSAVGARVAEGSLPFGGATIDVSDLTTGMYILQVGDHSQQIAVE